MCLITAFFFALSFMIKEILKAFIFSKIIFQSIEAHSYTHHYPQKAAGNCGIYPTATHLPPSFSESPFLWDEDHAIPCELLLSGHLEIAFLKTSLAEETSSPISVVGEVPG